MTRDMKTPDPRKITEPPEVDLRNHICKGSVAKAKSDMNLDDYDNNGNNIVPCPICLDVHCPSKEDGKCPEEDEYKRHMNQTLSTDSFESSRGGLVCPECGKPANLTTGYCEQHRSKSPFTMTQDTPEPVRRMVEELAQGLLIQPTGGDKCPVCKHSGTKAIEIEPNAETKRQLFIPALAYIDLDLLTTHATNLYNDAYNAGKERAERSKYVQNLVNDAVREGVKAEREKWATRLPEDTVQVTVEARVGSNVLANRKFAHVESIQLSSGTVLHTVASEAVSEILHEIIHPHPTHR